MQLVDFNGYIQNDKMYGGTAGRKIGIHYNGKDYMLKYPGNLKEKKMKNINMSYSNSPLCEYIGSQIYNLLEIPVHETILGTRSEKVVVACSDFLRESEKLYEFDKIKVTFEPHFMDSNGNETNGAGVDLYEILMTMEEHPILNEVDGVKERFWEMMVVDALIGNSDRNNYNWGIIVSLDGTKNLAPVYDNGNCLNSKWDDDKIKSILKDEKALEAEAYKGRRCIFEKQGRRINPYHLIESMEYLDCNKAVRKIAPLIERKWEGIQELLVDIPILSDVQRDFFMIVMEMRHKQIFIPVYEKVLREGLENRKSSNREERCR